MKKILLTIALVAGGLFSAQAQNDITLTPFSDNTSDGNNYALTVGSGQDDKCVAIGGSGESEIDAVGDAQVFTYDSATRALSLNGDYLTTYSVAEAAIFAPFFDGEYNALFSINSQGEYVFIKNL